MQTVVTYYKNLARWDVKSFLHSINIGENYVRLGSFLKKKKNQWNRSDNAPMLSLHFGGKFSERASNQIKGQLFVANKGDLVYSKIDLRNGAIGIIPESYPQALFTAEFPVYEIDTKIIHPTYLQLYLRSDVFKKLINSIVSGASGRKRVKPSDFENLSIYIPSLDIQMKIVNQWNAAQKEAQELNKKADEKEKTIDVVMSKELGIAHQNNTKRSGVFCVNFANLERWDVAYNAKELLTSKKAKYEWVKLKKFCKKAQYGYTGSAVEKDTGTKFLRITDLDYSGNYREENLPFVEILSGEKEKYLLNEKDFVVARTGATAGKCAIAKKHSRDVIFASYLIRFIFTKDIDLAFLEQYLNQGPGKRIVSEIVYSSGQPNINANEIQEIKIPLPPLSKQKEIAKKVESSRSAITAIRSRALEVLETTQIEIEQMLKA